jgi:hypothetical protein
MALVTVYSFTNWSIMSCEFKLQQGKRTARQIKTMDGCEVVRGTAEDVEERELDYYGRYFNKAKKFARG